MEHQKIDNTDELALSFHSNLNAFARMAHQEATNPEEIALPFESDLHPHPLTYTFSKLRLRKTTIDGMIEAAGSLNRLHEWPLLTIVAQTWGIPNLTRRCREVLSLFCRDADTRVPEKLQGELTTREWIIVQGLDLMNEELFIMRRSYVERIFEALRIFCYRPNPEGYKEVVTNINRDDLDLMDTRRSDMLFGMWPCDECTDIPSDILKEEFKFLLPWFTTPGSYKGCVDTLLSVLRQIEVNLRVDGNRGCNQLKHFCTRLLDKVTREPKPSSNDDGQRPSDAGQRSSDDGPRPSDDWERPRSAFGGIE
ncbi:hypothetical protein NCS52_01176600 [Fusarium sp. LHS14.1]|nr:hypothetical protein NCS52_01176600 [Fusarium sp. LHS14.1]